MLNMFRNNRRLEVSIERGEDIASLEGVTKRFGDFEIIKGIDLAIKKGEFVLISGPSGSGKSTVVRTLEGLEEPDEGTVNVFGKDWYRIKDADRKRTKRARMGVGFQEHNLDTGFSVRDNLVSLAESRGSYDPETLADIAVLLGLYEKFDAPDLTKLSGGEKQRVALGRLLVPKPELVIIDEPTAAIDISGKSKVYQAMRDISDAQGTTFVVVSHDHLVHNYADREIGIMSGEVVYDGVPDPVRNIAA